MTHLKLIKFAKKISIPLNVSISNASSPPPRMIVTSILLSFVNQCPVHETISLVKHGYLLPGYKGRFKKYFKPFKNAMTQIVLST